MAKGGYREGSGRKPTWKTPGKTQTVRVPQSLADRLLDLAHLLDEGEQIDIVTKPNKTIDLDGLKVYQFRGTRDWVRLSDLVRAGYSIENVTKSEE